MMKINFIKILDKHRKKSTAIQRRYMGSNTSGNVRLQDNNSNLYTVITMLLIRNVFFIKCDYEINQLPGARL